MPDKEKINKSVKKKKSQENQFYYISEHTVKLLYLKLKWYWHRNRQTNQVTKYKEYYIFRNRPQYIRTSKKVYTKSMY